MSDVNELKLMISKVLLPRIRQLEEEVASLRRHTWPYIHVNEDIETKREFFKNLDDDTVFELLRLKSKVSTNPAIQQREYDVLMNLRNNFC